MQEVPLEGSLVEALAKQRVKGAYWPLQIPATEKVETDICILFRKHNIQ